MVWPKRARKSSSTCAASGAEPDTNNRARSPICRADVLRRFQQAVHTWSARRKRTTSAGEIEKLRGGSLMFEALQQSHTATGDQPAMQSIAERMHMKQRQRQQQSIVFGKLPAGMQIDRVRHEVVVREDRAFGCAGGARGVDQCRGRMRRPDREMIRASPDPSQSAQGNSFSVISSFGSASARMCDISRSR